MEGRQTDGFSAEDDLSLTVTATTTEDDGDSTFISGTLEVTVEDIADPPTLDLDAAVAGEQLVGAADGLEDIAIPLDIRAELNDPLETMSITISGVPDGAVLSQFLRDDSFVRFITGPFGSGKSAACCVEIFRRAVQQKPSEDKVRRSKWMVVRSTYPQLRRTTIPTWQQWFDDRPPSNPQGGCIKVRIRIKTTCRDSR